VTQVQSGNGRPTGASSLNGGVPDPINPLSKGLSMEWKDQYKHPNWQRRRAEALESAEYKCQRCGDTETQLHVHHKRYIKGRMVWEYGTGELEVLCEPCHELSHAEKDALQEFIARLPSEAIPEILGLLLGYCEERPYPAYAQGDTKQFNSCDWHFNKVGFMAAYAAKIDDGVFIDELTRQMIFGDTGDVLTVKIPERHHG